MYRVGQKVNPTVSKNCPKMYENKGSVVRCQCDM